MNKRSEKKKEVVVLDDEKAAKERSRELRAMMVLYRDSKDKIKRMKMGVGASEVALPQVNQIKQTTISSKGETVGSLAMTRTKTTKGQERISHGQNYM